MDKLKKVKLKKARRYGKIFFIPKTKITKIKRIKNPCVEGQIIDFENLIKPKTEIFRPPNYPLKPISGRVKRTIKMYSGRYPARIVIYLREIELENIKNNKLNIPRIVHALLAGKKVIVEF